MSISRLSQGNLVEDGLRIADATLSNQLSHDIDLDDAQKIIKILIIVMISLKKTKFI